MRDKAMFKQPFDSFVRELFIIKSRFTDESLKFCT